MKDDLLPRTGTDASTMSPQAMQRLLAELAERELELEAKAEELSRLKAELAATRESAQWLKQEMAQRVGERMAQLRAILDTSMVGILIISDQGVIEEINGFAERMFGYAHDELLGKGLKALMPAPFCDQPDGHLLWLRGSGQAGAATAQTVGNRINTVIGRCKDGTTFPMQLGMTEICSEGGRRFTAVIRDLTKKWRLEDDLRQAQKLQIVGRLVSSIAHDFNNLLMGVGGCIDIAKSKLDGAHPAYRFLEEAKRSMTNRASIARPLLMFIRQPEAQFVSLEIDAVIEHNREMLRRLLGSDIELRLRLSAPGMRVSCEEGAIAEILMNLAANARELIAQGGRLSVESKLLLDGYVTLQVGVSRHAGGPLPPMHTGEPANASPQFKQRIGVSLGAVYGIAKQNDGHLEVSDDKDLELALSIHLPLAEAPRDAACAQARPVLMPLLEQCVLVVDQDQALRQSLRESLKRMGYRVQEAGDGAAALELCQQPERRIDLLIMDRKIAHSGAAGRHFAEEMASLNREVAMIYTTAERAELLGRDGRIEPGAILLRKPFTEIMLKTALQLALGGHALPKEG